MSGPWYPPKDSLICRRAFRFELAYFGLSWWRRRLARNRVCGGEATRTRIQYLPDYRDVVDEF